MLYVADPTADPLPQSPLLLLLLLLPSLPLSFAAAELDVQTRGGIRISGCRP
jgi:hypothetical protein